MNQKLRRIHVDQIPNEIFQFRRRKVKIKIQRETFIHYKIYAIHNFTAVTTWQSWFHFSTRCAVECFFFFISRIEILNYYYDGNWNFARMSNMFFFYLKKKISTHTAWLSHVPFSINKIQTNEYIAIL